MCTEEQVDYRYMIVADVFMPHLEKIIVDRPIHPERRLEEQELNDTYDKIFKKYGL